MRQITRLDAISDGSLKLRVHLRRHPNILKRRLVHVAAFNLGLVMRKVFGKGTPRGLQDYGAALFFAILRHLSDVWALRRVLENFMMASRRSPAHQSSQT